MHVLNAAGTHFATCALRFVRVEVPVDPEQPEGEKRVASMLEQCWHPCDATKHGPEWVAVATSPGG